MIDKAVNELRVIAQKIREAGKEKVTPATLAKASGKQPFIVGSLLAQRPDAAKEILDE